MLDIAIKHKDELKKKALDLGKAMKDIFEKFAFNKLKFSVVVGNPIEGS